ncbi:PREDICTED: subtilisin-like protease SBT5.6 [Ipomoea nil]|uniref:subtilisin-like protease SBT5.6 n=1 Tax=Ipomoea nil TaxID=35883 RepID=UPI0009014619|nr:PREDICTED: subtilisin-like protease SBT5.6 [Ipomoea nil]
MRIHCSIIVLFLVILNVLAADDHQRKVYVVYLGEHSGGKSFQEIEDFHCSFILSVKGGSREEARASLVHSYKNVINGFSALLTPDQANKISEMEGVISVFHSDPRRIEPHTTRSWDFVNLLEAVNGNPTGREELLSKAKGGKGVIVGMMDTGVWPESPSFSDKGMEPVPRSWKGICQKGSAFNSSHCNRKLIGARYYLKSYEATFGRLNRTSDFRSARDADGHGTHTASTVGGRRVRNAAALGGFGNGTASGGAPLVRLAIYKVCWPIPSDQSRRTCLDADILAAFDHAISDGVDVISVSLGAVAGGQYFTRSGIAIGALHAVKRNIVVACSAGNAGPTPSTVGNVAPWIITVGASSSDRVFSSPLKLGNGMIIEGQTITPIRRGKLLPLVYAGNVEIPGTTNNITTGLCNNGTLSRRLVRGKIVVCLKSNGISASVEVQRAGGAATIVGKPYNEIAVDAFLHPTTVVFRYELISILKYINGDSNPTATLLPGETVLGTKPAPVMAPFTSVGPSIIEPNILKPDITAPGLNILAAWSEVSSPTELSFDRRVVKYNIISGTSMSCPHVSAVAALIKAIHPDWSSAAIRSALMTTATTNNVVGAPIVNSKGYFATPFEYGAGHILPSKAADPGLVYNATYNDYLLFLCSRGINMDSSFKCPKKKPLASNLNYPSLSIANLRGSMTVKRTVTNKSEELEANCLLLKLKLDRQFKETISPHAIQRDLDLDLDLSITKELASNIKQG